MQSIIKLSDIEKELGDVAVALCFASQLPEVMENMKRVAARHTTLVPGVPVFGDVLFDDGFVRDHAEKMKAAANGLLGL